MDRALDRGAGRHVDDDAVAHEGGVERDRHVVGREHLAEIRCSPAESFCASACAIGRIARPASSVVSPTVRARTRRRRTRGAGTRCRASSAPASLARAFAAGVGRARERLGVAHHRAQIGVFPLLDAPMRQADRSEALERGRAQRRRAGQLALRRLPFGRELLLGGILHQGQFSHCVFLFRPRSGQTLLTRSRASIGHATCCTAPRGRPSAVSAPTLRYCAITAS